MDRLDAMAVFVAVAELRGFAPAARRLSLSPSAVTRLVAALESRLSTRLLQRTTRSVTLTDAGVRFLERSRRILADVAEAEENARADRTTPAGRFVLAAPTMFGRLEVAPILNAYATRYPAVVPELTLSDRMVHLVEEGVDAAVRIGELDDSSLVARRVGETRRVVVGSPRYLAGAGRLRSPDDLAGHRIIHLTSIAPAPEWSFRQDGARRAIAFRPCFATNAADAALRYATTNGALTMHPAYQVVAAVKAGKLRVVLAEFEQEPLPIQVVYPSTRLLSAKVRAFVDLVLERRGGSRWRFVDL